MILSDPSVINSYTCEGVWGEATLDALFRKSVRHHPDQIALTDPPDRSDFTATPARRLTYGEADEIIDDLCAMLGNLGVRRDDVIAAQLPNTVELPLLILACFRSGIILSILPPLWREYELEKALTQISPKVLITQNIKGDVDYPDLMRQTAAKVYSVRHILAYGDDVLDGIVAINDAISFAWEKLVDNPELVNPSEKITANDVAIITWNGVESPDLMVMPRSHNQLISAGLTVLLETSLEDKSSILCPFTLSSLSALGGFLVPWILTGGSLHIHQPFSWDCFKQQLDREQPTYTGLPPAAMDELCREINGGELDISHLKVLSCLWPVLGASNHRSNADTYLLPKIVDIFNIGEMAIFAHCRTDGKINDLLPHGNCKFPTLSGNGPTLLTTLIKGQNVDNEHTATHLVGELMIKGPMIYDDNFQPAGKNIQKTVPHERDPQGFIATGIECEIVDVDGPKLKPVDRRGNIIYHGGLAVSAPDLDAIYSEFPGIERGVAVSIADPVLGERITAAIIPGDQEVFSFDDFKNFLENRKLAPYKIPDQVFKVEEIPVDEDGHVRRHGFQSSP